MAKNKGLRGKWVEIFRAGSHTSSAGDKVTITDEDIESISAMYNERVKDAPDGDRAPAIKGHTTDSSEPAQAWMSETKSENGKLYGKFVDVVDSFEKEVEDKQYYNRSISLKQDFTILHVAFLGAVPPAVKGMADFSDFSESFKNKETQEFSTYFDRYGIKDRFQTLGRTLRSLKNYVIEKEGVEVADKMLSEYEIESMGNIPDWETKEENDINDNYMEESMDNEQLIAFNAMKESVISLTQSLSTLTESVGVIGETVTKMSADFSEIKTEGEAIKKEGEKTTMLNEFTSHAQNLVEYGKITAAQCNAQVNNFSKLLAKDVMEFGEGEDAMSVLDFQKNQLSSISGVKVVDFGEFAKKSNAGANLTQEEQDSALLKTLD